MSQPVDDRVEAGWLRQLLSEARGRGDQGAWDVVHALHARLYPWWTLLSDELSKQGLDATVLHTGGGCHAVQFPIDLTARDTERMVWVTYEGDYGPNGTGLYYIGFYDFAADECDEGISFELRAATHADTARLVRGMMERIWAAGS